MMECQAEPCKQPDYVCYRCAQKYGHKLPMACIQFTWFKDECGVCGRETGVTSPRNFRYLKPAWMKHKRKATRVLA